MPEVVHMLQAVQAVGHAPGMPNGPPTLTDVPASDETDDYALTPQEALALLRRLTGVTVARSTLWRSNLPHRTTGGGLRGRGHRRYRVADIEALAARMAPDDAE